MQDIDALLLDEQQGATGFAWPARARRTRGPQPEQDAGAYNPVP